MKLKLYILLMLLTCNLYGGIISTPFKFRLYSPPVITTPAPTTNGLLAYWSFDGNTTDSVGGNNLSASTPTLTNGTKGVPNTAYHFIAANSDYMYGGAVGNLNFSGSPDYTLSVWYKNNSTLASLAGWCPLGKWKSSVGYMALCADASGGLRVYADASFATFPAILPDTNTWTHLVCVKTGSNAYVYINGVGTGPNAIGASSISDSSGAYLTFNAYANGGGGAGICLTGDMDIGRVYNRALSTAEVLEIYNAEGTSVSTTASTGKIINGRSRISAPASPYWTDPLMPAERYTMNTNGVLLSGLYPQLKQYGTNVSGQAYLSSTAWFSRKLYTNSLADENSVIDLAGIFARGSVFTDVIYNYTATLWVYNAFVPDGSPAYVLNVGLGGAINDVCGVYTKKIIMFNENGYQLSAGEFQANTWTHLAMMRCDTNNIVTVYTNGVFACSSLALPPQYTSTAMTLGLRASDGAWSWNNGYIDEALLYLNTNLTPAQLQTLIQYTHPTNNLQTPIGVDGL